MAKKFAPLAGFIILTVAVASLPYDAGGDHPDRPGPLDAPALGKVLATVHENDAPIGATVAFDARDAIALTPARDGYTTVSVPLTSVFALVTGEDGPDGPPV